MNSTKNNENWRWWYDGIIDWMIENPGKKLAECAEHFGKRPSTISYIINSDAFKSRLAERRKDFAAMHDLAISEKAAHVATRALDILLEKMDKQRDKVGMRDAKDVASMAMQTLGFGQKDSSVHLNVNNPPPQVVVLPVSREALEASRNAIRTIEQRRLEAPVLEAEEDAAVHTPAA